MRQIILDTETTGLQWESGHRLIEIGALEMVNRRLTGRSFHYYLNPERLVDPGAYAIHGISDEFLKDKPKFSSIADALIEFIENAELIIHNAPFDIGFINAEFKRLNQDRPKVEAICRITDTLSLARQKHPGQSNNLDALCRRYQVNNTNRQLHGALLDSELLAQVYLRMTGGQVQLFNLEEKKSNVEHQHLSGGLDQPALAGQPLPVVVADPDELKAHENFLNLIKSQSDKCLWLDQQDSL